MMRMMAQATSLLALVVCASVAHAWLRPTFEDATLVARSELIVVAHLKAGSIQHVPHKRDDSRSWEHHATLVITKVLKGKCDKTEIPIIIHYGLDPREIKEKGSTKSVIEIGDSGGPGPAIVVKDAAADNLWFLRKRSGYFGREPGTGSFGIVDPEDLQPLQWQQYFLCYLADDPAAAVKDFVRMNPDKAKRARNYLDHLEVQRILKLEDRGKRLDGLLPFFLNRTTWDMKSEARQGIVGCGKLAGERLKDLFADPKHKNMRYDIIRMWRDTEYREVAPLLIDLLKQHDRFWAEQRLQKGWWNDHTNSKQTLHRQGIYGEVYAAVCTLRSFRDPRAQESLEMTRKRWQAINFENAQIVEECDAALRELAAREGDAKP
jgi:hypothetical protein